jgi:hypothetical protein
MKAHGGWRRSLATNTDGVRMCLVQRQASFHPDHVLPQVAEVVLTEEAFMVAEVEVA